MKKQTTDIKDYLHLYLGCEVMFNDKIMTLTAVGLYGYSVKDGENTAHDSRYFFIKPILRKLSDMTEEEFKECDLKTHPKFWMTDSNIWCFTAEKTKYLLSKHFDLFSLIESGLAIDATTIKAKNERYKRL